MIEQKLAAFKQRLLSAKATKISETPVHDMVKFMVFGHATFFAREIKLGEFAAFDHAGSSIRMVLDHIKSAQYPHNFHIKPPFGEYGSAIKGSQWDLKHTLEEAVKKLNIDKWGVEYTDFKPWPEHQPRNNEV